MIRPVLRTVHDALALIGIRPLETVAAARGMPTYLRNLSALKRSFPAENGAWPISRLSPCLADRYEESGAARGHYFHQDLLVARRIFEAQPTQHVDVGSRVDGFVAHVASFRDIEVLDIRALPSHIPHVSFTQCDLLADLPESLRGYTDSLSCLHALEHFGLGRYGDPVRADGHLAGLRNLAGIVRPAGILYLSVPMGPQRIEFDSQRVFSLRHLLDLVKPWFEVERFSYVDNAGDLHVDQALQANRIADNFGCRYGCAILELRRRGE